MSEVGTIGVLSIGNADFFNGPFLDYQWVIFWAKLTLCWAFCQSQKESLRMAVGRGDQKEHGIDGIFWKGNLFDRKRK